MEASLSQDPQQKQALKAAISTKADLSHWTQEQAPGNNLHKSKYKGATPEGAGPCHRPLPMQELVNNL